MLIHSARKLDAAGQVDDFWLAAEGGVITATGTGTAWRERPGSVEAIDAGGAWLTPGFLDLHGHGGGGHAFENGSAEILGGLRAHLDHGTTRSVISLVAAPLVKLRESLDQIATLAATEPQVLGSHLEGPFLNPERRGAHNPDFLREVQPEVVDELIAASRGTLRQLTIAPELPNALEAIEILVQAGVTVAVGHTEATLEQTERAFHAGARILTHAFNAMPGIHHRAPGPVIAALADERVTLELILDGLHVHPSVARLLFDGAAGRVALVTDAMAAAGADDGDYRLGDLNVTVSDGLAVLSGTSSIAGSTLTQDAALKRAIEQVGLAPAAAVAAVTSVPAKALGLGARFGRLAAGFAADAVLLGRDWQVRSVWCDGRRSR